MLIMSQEMCVMAKKGSSFLGCIRKSAASRLRVYSGLVRPHLEY